MNPNKSQSKNIAIGIKEFLIGHQVTIVAEDEVAKELNLVPLSDIDPKTIDFIISLGGDGTILRLIHRHPQIEAPMLGINLGSLGFLADIPITDIYPSLQDLINGHYVIQERMMIEGNTLTGNQFFAVNDIVIHRGQNPCLVDLAIHVDDDYLNTFSADGIIISTPCGSTAYSLSAGGPILSPEIKGVLLTPICPHTISNRPIVLLPKNEIQIQYISEQKPLEISYDGMSDFCLSTGEAINIKVSDRKFRIVNLQRHDYFTTLRTKLGWTGKLRI